MNQQNFKLSDFGIDVKRCNAITADLHSIARQQQQQQQQSLSGSKSATTAMHRLQSDFKVQQQQPQSPQVTSNFHQQHRTSPTQRGVVHGGSPLGPDIARTTASPCSLSISPPGYWKYGGQESGVIVKFVLYDGIFGGISVGALVL